MQITKDQLEAKYKSMKNEDLAEELGVSKVTLLKLLKDSGIKTKGKGNPYNRNKIEVV